jgi:drug/metabolite transporter (DMT)-like permease
MTIVAVVARAPWPRTAREWLHIGVAGLMIHAIYLGGVFIAISRGLPAPMLTERMHVAWTGDFVFALAWLVLVLSIGAITLLNSLIRHGDVSNIARCSISCRLSRRWSRG